MKVIVVNDTDTEALARMLDLAEHELRARFEQSSDHTHVVAETMRRVRYDVIGWIQKHGGSIR